ncbi:MAG: TRAP transporter small permease [Fretibacterium sp.]|nr:TRAP transporter small permease [Fretibacterium sp.]
MRKLGRFAESLYMGIGAAAMGLLAALVIFTVVARYCFSLSWKSVSEFNVTLFAFTTFWAMGLNVLRDEHVSINILYDKFRPAVKRWIAVLNGVVMLVVDGAFTYYSWLYAQKMGTQISQGMEVPMLYMYGIMPLSGVLCAVCVLIKIVSALRAPLSAFEPRELTLEELADR